MNGSDEVGFQVDRGLSILESLDIGLGVMGANGVLRYLNAPAQRFLRDTQCFVRHPDGRLLPCQHHDHFRHLIQQLGSDESAEVEHILLTSVCGKKYPILMKADERDGEREIVMIFPKWQRNLSPQPSLLATWYELTHAEARLLSHLASGKSLNGAAQTCAITVGTARIHLKHILQKTGFHRQTDLLLDLLSKPMMSAMC